MAGIGLPMVVHLPNYYAGHLGLPLAAVGFVFTFVRLIDIGFDPLIGWLMDRTRSRLGRFRLWLILSAPVLMLAAWMLFMAEPGVGTLHLWIWLAVVYVGFSMGSLSQTAWAAVLSPDYNERSRIYGWWQTGNVLGLLMILLVPPVVEFGLKGSRIQGVQAMGWTIIALLPITIGLAAWRVTEPAPDAPSRNVRSVGDYLDLLRDPAVARLMLADLLMGWAPGITAALFLFYFDQIKGVAETQANLLLLVYFLAAMLGAPAWSWLATRIGKHRALAVNAVITPAVLLLVMAVPMRNFGVAAAVMALAGLPYSGASVLLRAMLADAGDQLRLKTGVDRTALLYSVLSGTGKIGSALALTTFIGLDALGFHAQGHGNSPVALAGLQAMFVGLPAALTLLSAAVIMGYRLDASRHAEIRAALARRGDGG